MIIYKGTFAKKIEEKRFECENVFYRELEEDKIRWKQSSDQIIYDLMYDPHFINETTLNSILAAKDMKMRLETSEKKETMLSTPESQR